jgi:hypothetical protein
MRRRNSSITRTTTDGRGSNANFLRHAERVEKEKQVAAAIAETSNSPVPGELRGATMNEQPKEWTPEDVVNISQSDMGKSMYQLVSDAHNSALADLRKYYETVRYSGLIAREANLTGQLAAKDELHVAALRILERHHEKQLASEREKVKVLVEALESIAANTCCDKCQEAALVAKAALAKVSTKQAESIV